MNIYLGVGHSSQPVWSTKFCATQNLRVRITKLFIDETPEIIAGITDQPPAEFAVISFEDWTIQPLLNVHPWFSAGNYGIDCEFKVDGAIDLLIHYCPYRYK